MKSSVRIAFCGIIGALSVVIMFLSGVIPVASIGLPALAGCLLISVVAECGEKWGWAVYGVTAILSFFMAADREAFLIYLLFFGYYPVLYSALGKIRSKVLQYGLKILIFNAAAIADFFIITYVFGIPFETIELLGSFTPVVLLVLANIVFIIYDYALSGVIRVYFMRLHPIARKLLFKNAM